MELYNNDCFEVLKRLPDKSVDLFFSDIPYNIGKGAWDKIDNYISWCMNWVNECKRVLKDNGTLIFWHNDFLQASQLITAINSTGDWVYNSVGLWHKPNFRKIAWVGDNVSCRSWFNIFEFFVVFTNKESSKTEWDKTGWDKVKLDVNNFQTLRKYAYEMLCFIGGTDCTGKKVEKDIKSRCAEHFFYCIPNVKKKNFSEIGGRADHFTRYGTTQWELCTPETYQLLIDTYNLREWDGFREYEDLRQEYEDLRQEYEDLRPKFNKEPYETYSNYFTSDIHNTGKLHPCEKPIDITEKVIKTHSNPGAVVLDPFMGSGTTGVACVNTGRKFIGVELDEGYFNIAKNRIEEAERLHQSDASDFLCLG